MKYPKKLSSLISLLSLVTSVSSYAQDKEQEIKTRIIRDITSPMTLQVSPDLVRCSQIGYSHPELKLSVPNLGMLTHFHHAVVGEIYPCITAGPCGKGRMPEDLLKADEPSVEAQIRVDLKEKYYINHTKKTCDRVLEEHVNTKIRGFDFAHERFAEIGDFPYELCTKL